MSINNILHPNNYTIFDKNSVIDTLTIVGDDINQSITTTQLYNAAAFSGMTGAADSLYGFGKFHTYENVLVGDGLSLNGGILSTNVNSYANITHGIDLTTIGSTKLFTVPGDDRGPRFYLNQVIIILNSQIGLTAQPTFAIGTNDPDYNDVLLSAEVTAGFGINGGYVNMFINSTDVNPADGGADLFLKITAPAMATSAFADFYVIGYLI